MLYAIIATDVANSLQARLAARPAHLERLQVLKGEGRIVLAGPHPVSYTHLTLPTIYSV